MKRTYETAVVFDGSLTDEQLAKEQENVEKLLQKNVTFEKTDVWGRRELAYEINKKKSGYYCFFIYQDDGSFNEKMGRQFKLNQKILRHMTLLYEPTPQVSTQEISLKRQTDEGEGEE